MNERIIKAASVLKGESYSATLEASQIIAAAQAQARKILDEAEQARHAAFETARNEAYEHGLSEWNTAVVEAQSARDRHIAESEPELIRLAIRIAQKLIGEELRTNPEAIVGIARECLRGVGRERSLTIRVPAADFDVVRRRIVLLREAAGPNRSIEVVADSVISPGGCIVESEFGIIDARLETQLRCMEQVLLRVARK